MTPLHTNYIQNEELSLSFGEKIYPQSHLTWISNPLEQSLLLGCQMTSLGLSCLMLGCLTSFLKSSKLFLMLHFTNYST